MSRRIARKASPPRDFASLMNDARKFLTAAQSTAKSAKKGVVEVAGLVREVDKALDGVRAMPLPAVVRRGLGHVHRAAEMSEKVRQVMPIDVVEDDEEIEVDFAPDRDAVVDVDGSVAAFLRRKQAR